VTGAGGCGGGITGIWAAGRADPVVGQRLRPSVSLSRAGRVFGRPTLQPRGAAIVAAVSAAAIVARPPSPAAIVSLTGAGTGQSEHGSFGFFCVRTVRGREQGARLLVAF